MNEEACADIVKARAHGAVSHSWTPGAYEGPTAAPKMLQTLPVRRIHSSKKKISFRLQRASASITHLSWSLGVERLRGASYSEPSASVYIRRWMSEA